jgi:hypothetical protein
MYKEITRKKVRFNTNKGMLTVEQLWDLSLDNLDALAVNLQESYEKSKGKSFLSPKSEEDKETKLQFDVVLDILKTKVEEAEIAKAARETKKQREKILGIIKEKEEEQLRNLSKEELEKLL